MKSRGLYGTAVAQVNVTGGCDVPYHHRVMRVTLRMRRATRGSRSIGSSNRPTCRSNPDATLLCQGQAGPHRGHADQLWGEPATSAAASTPAAAFRGFRGPEVFTLDTFATDTAGRRHWTADWAVFDVCRFDPRPHAV